MTSSEQNSTGVLGGTFLKKFRSFLDRIADGQGITRNSHVLPKQKREIQSRLESGDEPNSAKLFVQSPPILSFMMRRYQPERAQFFGGYATYFFWPPYGFMAYCLNRLLMIGLVYVCLISVMPKQMEYGEYGFSYFITIATALIVGWLVSLFYLPPLLGMLVGGILTVNILSIKKDKYWNAIMRRTALAVILCRAGLGLDPAVLSKLGSLVFRLAFVPCIVESLTSGVAAHFFLGLPWPYAFMQGFVLGAVSPAVVVPTNLILQSRGYGVEEGIPTLLIAASSIDDVLAISIFGIILGSTFATEDISHTIAAGPVETLLGVALGGSLGLLLWVLPGKDEASYGVIRVIALFLSVVTAMHFTSIIHTPGAGPLSAMFTGFVCNLGWKTKTWTSDSNPVITGFAVIWLFVQPVLFGLIGTEIEFATLEGNTVIFGLLTMTVGLTFRMIAAFTVCFGAGFSFYDKLYVALAWIPKATVQAAVGPIVLDEANKQGLSDPIEYGKRILTTAVLVILVSAPLGAALIMITGRKRRCHLINFFTAGVR